jgi:hypothetical protein
VSENASSTNVQANSNIVDEHTSGIQLQNGSTKASAPLFHYLKGHKNKQQRNKGKSSSTSKPLSTLVDLDHQMASNIYQDLPLIMRNMYLKIEDIDLNELMVTLVI